VKLNIYLWFGMIAMVKLNKVDELVVSTLKNADKGLTLAEIAERIGESEKKVFKTLRKLFENEMVNCENRQYKLTNR
jgi:Mn-dependent DtxR family transcriptional regulator